MQAFINQFNQEHVTSFLGLLLAVLLLLVAKRIILVRLLRSASDEKNGMGTVTRIVILSADSPLSLFILCLFIWSCSVLANWFLPDLPAIELTLLAVFKAGLIITFFYFPFIV